ncbi:hypothetical protein GW17_00057397 [Ensete ventricosum]|nr:hypothetical protein GW17_00057397 [Ensete ventricosum]
MGIFSLVTGLPGPSGFGSSSTAEQVTVGVDASNLTVIITETARVFALRGAHVIIAARNMEAATDAKQLILKTTPSARVDLLELDLSSLKSVRAFSDKFLSMDLPLNILMYSGKKAYGQSKLANILHANELSRRLQVLWRSNVLNPLHLVLPKLSRAICCDRKREQMDAKDRHLHPVEERAAGTHCGLLKPCKDLWLCAHIVCFGGAGSSYDLLRCAASEREGRDGEVLRRLQRGKAELVGQRRNPGEEAVGLQREAGESQNL